jgi:hypothetical protein
VNLLTLLACALPAPEWQTGDDLSALSVDLVYADEGVHPATTVLDSPHNPFDARVLAVKWEILATDCAQGFYAFATALAVQPTGEHQLYTAQCMADLVNGARLTPEDDALGWHIAIDGYQAVLDHFSDDLTYDATGTYAWPVAPLAYEGILDLGGEPLGWVAVEGEDGEMHLVKEGGS